MIRRPRDVHAESFLQVMRRVPKGAVLQKTKRVLWWRDFYFLLDKPSKKYRRGDMVILSVPLRFM